MQQPTSEYVPQDPGSRALASATGGVAPGRPYLLKLIAAVVTLVALLGVAACGGGAPSLDGDGGSGDGSQGAQQEGDARDDDRGNDGRGDNSDDDPDVGQDDEGNDRGNDRGDERDDGNDD